MSSKMSVYPKTIASIQRIVENHIKDRNVHEISPRSLPNLVISGNDNDKVDEKVTKVLEKEIIAEKNTVVEKGTSNSLIDHENSNSHLNIHELSVHNYKEINLIDKPQKRQLHIHIMGGKAFLDHLINEPTLPGQPSSTFQLYMHYRNQRFRSNPTPCCCDPHFDEHYILDLSDDNEIYDSINVMTLSAPVHFVMIKEDRSGEKQLVCSHFLDWRIVLCSWECKKSFSMEVQGIGPENGISVGLLEVKLEFIPKLQEPLSEERVHMQMSLEQSQRKEWDRLFLIYTKQWWREYLQIQGPQNSSRAVKIFALDENSITRSTCSFIRPLSCGRLIESPVLASWFVALIPLEEESTTGGLQHKEWKNIHTLLALKCGSVEDHATLLCSLLVGFGLEAYVCVGTVASKLWYWVMTIGCKGVIFWESTTGSRYNHTPIRSRGKKPLYDYERIDCVFNDKTLYANCQASNKVDACSFDLCNKCEWKEMSESSISSVCNNKFSYPRPPLCPVSIDPIKLSTDLEIQLKTLFTEYRLDFRLHTTWDDNLSYLMSQSLYHYEMEHRTGIHNPNVEFCDAITRYIPKGASFKGFPLRLPITNPRRIMAHCMRHAVCEEILKCNGDSIQHAIRIQIYPFPEDVLSIWLLLACKYTSVT